MDNAQNIGGFRKGGRLENSLIHLVEYDIGMRRCGGGNIGRILYLARQIAGCPHLVFEGVQAYAGNLAHQVDSIPAKKSPKRLATV